jgi:acetyl-CoA acetyltransferase
MTPSGNIAIVGIGETPFVRRSDRSLFQLALDASLAAIEDAGLDPQEIDGIVTDASYMPLKAPADEIARSLGIRDRLFTAHALVGGAGVVGAPLLARLAINAGLAKNVLSYYGADFGSLAGGPYSFPAGLDAKSSVEIPFGWYGQPLYFAAMAQRYSHDFGLTESDLGAVALSTRQHAALTPGAMRQSELSIDEYLASPIIAHPFRAHDCSLINDGGSAFVMTSLERARHLRRHPVRIAGIGIGSVNQTQGEFFSQHPGYPSFPASVSAPRAYADAGLGPDDMDFAEIYDCFTISTLLQLEGCGFCERGEAAAFVADGRIGPGGDFPVNTHGGLLSHSYMVGAGHVVEAVRQLRHERETNQVPNAEVGLVAGLGVPDHATLILTRDDR